MTTPKRVAHALPTAPDESSPSPTSLSAIGKSSRKRGVAIVALQQPAELPSEFVLTLDDRIVKTWYAPTTADAKRNAALKPFRGTEREFFAAVCRAGNYPMEALLREGALALARRIYTASFARKSALGQGVFGSANAKIARAVEALVASGVDPATLKPSQIVKASDGAITSFRSVERWMRVNGVGIPPKRIENVDEALAAIKAAWPTIVPESLRETSEPADIARKTLRVRCFTREAGHRLALESAAIVKAIGEQVPEAAAIENLKSTIVKPAPRPKPVPAGRARGAATAKAKRTTVKRNAR